MLNWIREKFGTVVIGGIISFIAFVFVFYGVFSPKSTRGLHEGAVAGTVNGDSISIADYNRELNRRLEFFKNIGGGKISEEQLKSFHLKEVVFQELSNRKILLQQANKQGLMASDAEVKEKIQEIPAFQKEGKFDFLTYKQVLESNGHTPGSFERLVREDFSVQRWENFFKEVSRVSEDELRREYLIKEDKRNIKYVVVTPDTVKKNISVDGAEVQKFLADPARMNIAKQKFEEGKKGPFKDKTFDGVKEQIARNILAENKTEEVLRNVQKVSDEVLATVAKQSSQPDAKLNATLKPHAVEVRTSGWLTRKNPNLPGFGEMKEVLSDAFKAGHPIDIHKGGKPKKFQSANRVVVAWVSASETPDLAKLEEQRSALMRQVSARKSRDLFQSWMKAQIERSKIDVNPAVVQAE